MTQKTPKRPEVVQFEAIDSAPSSSLVFRHFRCPFFPFTWHYHPEVELTLIVEGRGLRFVGDSIDSYREGDLCLLGSNLPHSWQSDPEAGAVHSMVIQFSAAAWPGAFATLPELRRVTRLVEAGCRRGLHVRGATASGVRAGIQRIAEQEPGSLKQLTCLLESLDQIAVAAESTTDEVAFLSKIDMRVGERNDQAGKLKLVLDRLDESVGGKLPSQAELAELAGITPAALSRLFKGAFGKTYIEYVNAWRVCIAGRLLVAEPTMPVADVAHRAGFENLSNFHRRFQAVHRVTPRGFRASRR